MTDNSCYIFKVGHLNVRSIFTNFNNFTDLMASERFDVMCISETWIASNYATDMIHLPNYLFFHKDKVVEEELECISMRIFLVRLCFLI